MPLQSVYVPDRYYKHRHPQTGESIDVRYPRLGEMYVTPELVDPLFVIAYSCRIEPAYNEPWIFAHKCKLDDIGTCLREWIRWEKPEFVYFIGWR